MLSVKGAVLVFVDGPLHIMRDKQVQLAIIVIVEPHRAGGEAGVGHAGFRGYISKLAVAKIAEKMIAANGGDIDVVKAIIVVVANRTTQAIYLDGQAGCLGYICEGAILIIMV